MSASQGAIVHPSAARSIDRAPARMPELDWAKGLCILAVISLHANSFDDSIVFRHTVNRAVSVFLVLFGVSSELYWRKSDRTGGSTASRLGKWYGRRLRRLMVPWWTVCGLWWLATLYFHIEPLAHIDPWRLGIMTALGCAPWTGTTWFVAVVLQWVLLFPLIRALVAKTNLTVALLIAAAVSAYCSWQLWNVIDLGRLYMGNALVPPGWFAFWSFSPRAMWHVVSGIVLVRSVGARLGRVGTLTAIAITGVGMPLFILAGGPPGDNLVRHLREGVVITLLDVPLALALLGLVQRFRMPALPGRVLAWLGVHSWGLYLGHVLVDEVIHMAGWSSNTGSHEARIAYFFALLAAASVLVMLGEVLRSKLRGSVAPAAGVPRRLDA
jgi:peptidoglycan/LPS O-acetylase OafA/YrhL